ncbi:MAG: EamA family transporter [Elusimicrobia bacterium]|nr:EamA family transporter [Elusimicrobiota bacterium]
MSNTAFVFSLLAIFCWALGALFDKFAVLHLSPTTTFFARFYLIFVLIFPFLILQWDRTRQSFLQLDRNVPLFVLGSVVFTMAGLYFYYHALSGSEASKVVPLCSTYPLVAFLMALVFLGETFTLNKLLGTLLVVGGIFCLTR